MPGPSVSSRPSWSRRVPSTGADGGDGGRAAGNLLELLRAPARHAPTSLAGQLRYIREHWPALLGDDLGGLLDRLDVAIGVLTEEERGLHLRFGGGDRCRANRATARSSRASRRRRSASAPTRTGCRGVVLIAKSTYVWLDQLSQALRARHPDARRDPGRGARPARALGCHRALADRPVGALAGLGADQAAARQSRTRWPRPTRSTTTGSPTTSAARQAYANLRDRAWTAGHPPGERHGAQPHGHRLPLGHRAPGVVPVGPGAAVPGLHVQRSGPVAGRAACRSSSRTTTGTTRDAAVVFKRHDRGTGDEPLHLPRQRRHQLPVERHRAARLPQRPRSASR